MPSGHCRGLHNFQHLDNFPTVRSHHVAYEFWQRLTVPRLQHSWNAERFTILRTGHLSWHALNCLFHLSRVPVLPDRHAQVTLGGVAVGAHRVLKLLTVQIGTVGVSHACPVLTWIRPSGPARSCPFLSGFFDSVEGVLAPSPLLPVPVLSVPLCD